MSRLAAALALVEIASISRDEAAIADYIERALAPCDGLEVVRIENNVVARTTGTSRRRVIVAGHVDTVPGDPTRAVLDGATLRGLGAADMKGSLSVMLELALADRPRSVDVTWIFYAKEEIARAESGLLEIAGARPDLLVADVAVLAEPTGGAVEAGCQGTLRAEVTLAGVRAHAARPARGRNALHRLAPVIERVAGYRSRAVALDGVTYAEQLQCVLVTGGVAANVVPDAATLTLNHRFAPDRTAAEAAHWLEGHLRDLLEDGDAFHVVDAAPAAPPSLDDPALRRLVELTGTAPAAKLGWTDVATFSERGVPATNFGAGDPERAHRADEYVTEEELDEFARTLESWLDAI